MNVRQSPLRKLLSCPPENLCGPLLAAVFARTSNLRMSWMLRYTRTNRSKCSVTNEIRSKRQTEPEAVGLIQRTKASEKVFLLLLLGVSIFGTESSLKASDYVFPNDFGAINVKTWNANPALNAKGDGVTDDTTAIQAAITYSLTQGPVNARYAAAPLVYFPNGTYLVSNRLETRQTDHSWSYGWLAGVRLIGQNRTNTIIKLKNNCPGYTDSGNPKSVIRTGTENGNDDGGGNEQGFRHSIQNLTLDIGSGNPGASGIEFLASNRGALEDITIRSSDTNRVGFYGIDMRRFATGPAMIKDVQVIGFQWAAVVDNYEMSVTLENFNISNQAVGGIYNTNNQLFIRNFTSQNSVPAITIANSNGFVTLVDATLTGGAGGTAAISNGGKMFIRNISSSGYGSVVNNSGGDQGNLNAGTSGIWTSHGRKSLFTPPAISLNLPVEATPVYTNGDLSQWAGINSYGATPDNDSNDDATAIQQSIDSGKSIVYLPHGDYGISTTIVIRNNVQKVIGGHAAIHRKNGFTGPIIRFDSGTPSTVVVEHLNFYGNITHNSGRALSIRHCDITEGVSNTANGTGKLFLEDVICGPLSIHAPMKMWARQLNIEYAGLAVDNDGATVWILGLKTENLDINPAIKCSDILHAAAA